MKKRWIAGMSVLMIIGAAIVGTHLLGAQEPQSPKRLVVVWRSGDPEIFNTALYLFTHNAKRFKWFDEVTLVVWGPSQKLLVEDEQIQAKVKKMQADGVQVMASIDCANEYGLQDTIRDELGIRVMIMGPFLTRYLQEGRSVLTF